MDKEQKQVINVYKLWEQHPVNRYDQRIVDRPWQIKIELEPKYLSHTNYNYRRNR